MKKVLFLLALLLSVNFLVSCSKKEITFKQKHVTAKVFIVKSKTITNFAEFPATIISQKEINISSSPLNQFTFYLGRVDKILADVGDVVKKGQLLVVVDPIQTQNTIEQMSQNINQAKANLDFSKANFERYKNLYSQEVISKEEFQKIQMQYKTAFAQYKAACAAYNGASSVLSYFEIRAPFSGIVSNKFVDAGQVVSPMQPIISLIDPKDLEVKFYVGQDTYNFIKNDLEIPITFNHKTIMAKITNISPKANEITHTYLIKAKINYQKNILPGDYATANIPIGKKEVILIPESCVLKRAGIDGVFIVKNGISQYQMIQKGKQVGEFIEVLSGLQLNDKVITNNLSVIENGDIIDEK